MKCWPTLTSIDVRVGSLSVGWHHTAPSPYEMWTERNKAVEEKAPSVKEEGLRNFSLLALWRGKCSKCVEKAYRNW